MSAIHHSSLIKQQSKQARKHSQTIHLLRLTPIINSCCTKSPSCNTHLPLNPLATSIYTIATLNLMCNSNQLTLFTKIQRKKEQSSFTVRIPLSSLPLHSLQIDAHRNNPSILLFERVSANFGCCQKFKNLGRIYGYDRGGKQQKI